MSKKKVKLINSDGNLDAKDNFEYIEFTYIGKEDKKEEIKEEVKEEQEEIKEEFEDVSKIVTKKDDSIPTINNETVIYGGSNKLQLKKHLYISFRTRVLFYSIIGIVSLFVLVFSFIFLYNASKPTNIKYNEYSSISYDTCTYNNTCFSSDKVNSFIPANTQNINLYFKYNVSISEKIEYNINYYLRGEFKIVDKDNNDIVLYSKEDNLVESQNISDTSKNIKIKQNYNLNYSNYYNEVVDYIKTNNLSVIGILDIKLYTADSKDKTNVSSISLNIGEDTVTPVIKNTKHMNKIVKVDNNNWNDNTTGFTIVCIICVLVLLFSVIRLSNLLIKTLNRKSHYQKTLNRLLRVYDSDIVIARDGYQSDENKKIIKLISFDELLDAKNSLHRPIIYYRVNDVKSHFIVEDRDSIYMFVLKDLDF